MTTDARTNYEEGLYIPLMHFARAGTVDQTLTDIVAANVREPIQVVGDLYSLATCNEIGCRRLIEMMDEFAIDDLDRHRLIAYGGSTVHYLDNINSVLRTGRDARNPRTASLTVNNIPALRRAVANGVGIAVLPDYMVGVDPEIVRVLPQADMPEMDCFLVYAEEMKNVARVQAFRDFLVSKAQRWRY